MEEEKKLTIELDGEENIGGINYPIGSAVGDAGWSKISYGKNFTARSGAGVLIGKNT